VHRIEFGDAFRFPFKGFQQALSDTVSQ
jgi:hypothetical protein